MIDPIVPPRGRRRPVRGGLGRGHRRHTRRRAPATTERRRFRRHAGADGIGRGERGAETRESSSVAGIQGRASVQQVVEAVMSAEQTLQGAVAIRDKVVAAYLEISRMQI